ncbi:extracellular solute-binding protein [Streptomyces sp. NPDC048275]|uniref:ABC transporter substrate-binding protein n=1 Tax=Streptomyces sp. NPDC048275 TaxID=3155629 RepID=UPI0033F4D72F
MIARRTFLAAGLSAGLSSTLVSACDNTSADGSGNRVTLDFFQFKTEAVGTFAKIIKAFEAEHPGIRVVQNNVPSPATAMRARLVRNDVPDVITLNGDSVFGEIARAGVFHDFSGDEAAAGISPAVQKVLDGLGTGAPHEANGLPFASNADGVIYNKDLFAEHDVAVPTTWSELLAAAETFHTAGVTPFYGALKEAWTCLPPLNTLASNLQPPDTFFQERLAGRTTFAEAYAPVADKLAQLYRYTQQDTPSRDYNAGNQAFAQGKAAMYLQGVWAIPAIKTFKPAFEIGTFALPVTDDASATRLVSGVDVAVTMGRKPRHPAESMAFISYLMRPAVMRAYAAEQLAFPTLKGSSPEDPALAGLRPYFDSGRIVAFSDHRIPLSVQLDSVTQQFLFDGRRDSYLRALDSEWDKYQARHN